MNVDLPAPFGPVRPKRRCGGNATVTLSNSTRPAYAWLTSWTLNILEGLARRNPHATTTPAGGRCAKVITPPRGIAPAPCGETRRRGEKRETCRTTAIVV